MTTPVARTDGACDDAPMDSELRWTADEASAMDRWLVDDRGFTIDELMATAGRRVAATALALCRQHGLERVVLLVGPGNNGGDASVAGRHVRDAGLDVTEVRPLDGEALPQLDARTLVVDGLFGVGLSRPIEGDAAAAVDAVNASYAKVLSVDVPSGLDATSGEILGTAVRPDCVVTFVGPKQGFFVGQGPEVVGDEWIAVDIGFPISEAEAWLRGRRDTLRARGT